MMCNVCEGLIERSCQWSHKERLREQDKQYTRKCEIFKKVNAWIVFYIYTFGHATLQEIVAYEDIQKENLF